MIPDWLEKPVAHLELDVQVLRSPLRAIERKYVFALEALAKDEVSWAVDSLREVVAEDNKGRYTTAKLLLCLAATELGEEATARPLAALPYSQKLDSVAARRILRSRLHVFTARTDRDAPIRLTEALRSPVVAINLAAGAYLLRAGRIADAANAFDIALDVGTNSDDHPLGVASELCALYERLKDYDAMLETVEAYWFPQEHIWKARALAGKGLTDAALLVWDEAIKDEESHDWSKGNSRYFKADLMLDIGDISGARRELAKLFAKYPRYEDFAGLHEKASAAAPAEIKRKPISEAVRHAVWRRDGGKCVECGSRENLEFDHIIPFSRGGADTERNLQLLCGDCNRKKSATI